MVKSLLQPKAAERPTCAQIMSIPVFAARAQKFYPEVLAAEMQRSGPSTPTHRPSLMKTIFFSNRERIMIGEDHVQYMNYLQKKLPAPAYTDDESDHQNDTKISIGEEALNFNSKRQQFPS